MNNTSRRRFLAAGSAATFGALSGAAQNSDAELLTLGKQLLLAWENETQVFAGYKGDCSNKADQITESAIDATRNVVKQIEKLSATTLAGLIVKAQAISWCHSGYPFDDDSFNDQATTDVRLAASIMRDLLALA